MESMLQTFDTLSLEQLRKIRAVYDDFIRQIGGIVLQDYNTALVVLPNAISAEIKRKEQQILVDSEV